MNCTEGKWKIRRWLTSDGAEGFTLYVEENGLELVLARDIVNEANANVMAAAPNMYERLKATTDLLESLLAKYLLTAARQSLSNTITENKQALAKAEGK